MTARACWLAALALAAAPAGAETLFVIDQLVVNVSSAPGGEGDRVATLKSGDRVEALDRQGDDTQVQLANGNQGWVKSSYLSSDPPLQRRLQDRAAEIDKLKQNVARLEAQLAAARTGGPAGAGAGPSTGGSTAGTAAAAPGAGAMSANGATSGAGSISGAGGMSGARPGRGTRGAGGAPAAPDSATGAPATSPETAPVPAGSQGAATHNDSLLSDSADQSPWPVWAWASGCSAVALALGFLLGWRALDRRIRRKYGGLRIY